MEASDPRAVIASLAAGSGESLAALSRMLRRNEAYLHQFITRGTPRLLAERDRALLAAYFRVDEAMLGGPARAAAAPMVAVRRLDVAASAGPGALPGDDPVAGIARFDAGFLDRLGVRRSGLSLLRAEGDSMAPLIEHGDEMLIDENDRRAGAGVFVLRLDGVLLVKRVAREGRLYRITSDNPAAPAIPLQSPGTVRIVGRVVWLSRALK